MSPKYLNGDGNNDIDYEAVQWRRNCSKIEAYEKIFKFYYADLFGYGMELCGNTELVKDTIQDIFVRVWERKNKINEIESIKAYLIVSLRREILKTLKKRRRIHNSTEDVSDYPETKFSIEEIIIREELVTARRKQLRRALAELSPRQREVLYLKFYNGMSYHEIGQILDIKYQSVRNFVYRGVRILKKIMWKKEAEILLLFFVTMPIAATMI